MFVQPKARSGVNSCQRHYRIVNFYHSCGGEHDCYAARLLCHMAADKASTAWSDAKAVNGAKVWQVKLSSWLARQRELAAAYICHSFSSTPAAPVCTRATIFQGSHCWHLRFLRRLKVTPLDSCGSDTLLLPHRFILHLHMLQPPPATLLSLSQNFNSIPQQESQFQLQMEREGRWKLNSLPALLGRIFGGKSFAPQNVFESLPPIVAETNLSRCWTSMPSRGHLLSKKKGRRKLSKIFSLVLQSHQHLSTENMYCNLSRHLHNWSKQIK